MTPTSSADRSESAREIQWVRQDGGEPSAAGPRPNPATPTVPRREWLMADPVGIQRSIRQNH